MSESRYQVLSGHQVASARQAWCDSDEGRQASAGRTEGQFLVNRLNRAFLAGMEAGLRALGERLTEKG